MSTPAPAPVLYGILLRPIAAAVYLGVTANVLRVWRQRGIGPNWIDMRPPGDPRAQVYYREGDILEFSLARTKQSKRMPEIQRRKNKK